MWLMIFFLTHLEAIVVAIVDVVLAVVITVVVALLTVADHIMLSYG